MGKVRQVGKRPEWPVRDGSGAVLYGRYGLAGRGTVFNDVTHFTYVIFLDIYVILNNFNFTCILIYFII